MHVFTSITVNYIPKARILAHSIKKFHPTVQFYLVLSDTIPEWFCLDDEPFDAIVTAEQLGIENFNAWAFKHTVVEICTAIKGIMFQYLFREIGAEKIFYLDPDMVVFSSMNELLEKLDDSSLLLTPHQTIPENDMQAILDNEICSLKHGVFNLGFLAVKSSIEGLKFVDWWAKRLYEFCYDDIAGGLFTDQRWADLVPCFFNDVTYVRETNYNVATWNLTHRRATGSLSNGLYINGLPLAIYHFSGFDSGAQEIMLKRYGKHSPVLMELREWYKTECKKMGQSTIGKLPSAYSVFDNGEVITKSHRVLYRSRQDVQSKFKSPFSTSPKSMSYYHWYLENSNLNGLDLLDTDISTVENLRMNFITARQELDAIKSSHTWKLLSFIRNMKHKISQVLP